MIIAGGGTGGHLFPGIAIAEEFLRRNRGDRILFVGTNKGIEKRVLESLGFSLQTIDVEGIKGKGWMKSLAAILRIPISLIQSLRIVRGFSPELVIGVGGYASGPVVFVARLLGIRAAIAEQNALPGLTNRILGKVVDRVFVSFAQTGQWFHARKVMVSGNPIRHGFAAEMKQPKEQNRPFTLLVFGGSQGAHAVNRAMLEALDDLGPVKEHLRIIHQTGGKDLDVVAHAYRAKGVTADVLPFIMDMAAAYQTADLLVCRAGATSIAEITAAGKAAILIPFPAAVEDHQTKNAEVLVQADAAEMIPEKELTGARLAAAIKRYYESPQLLREMEIRSAGMGNIRAAEDIVDACLALVQRGDNRDG
ncbi:MAG: undecaprenyldiphospho-muramoylpentapeptide beta-N-acetylglucosaminyltransferase [Syntrophales bacterium]|nr:undecaprenyldiphospho-muramoylpentapeptide beta-N-acetylglucosaminyltransferase [Syntrophales bacterium]